MRLTFFVVTGLILYPAALPGGDKAPNQSLADDGNALKASAWVNEKPDAA